MYTGHYTGKCFVCGVSVSGRKKYCDSCAKSRAKDARARWRQSMIEIGACIECGRQSGGDLLCDACKAKQSERRKERVLLKLHG